MTEPTNSHRPETSVLDWDESGEDDEFLLTPYDHADLPVVALTYGGHIQRGRDVLERIVETGQAELVLFYRCGAPECFMREREVMIRRAAVVLEAVGQERALLKAAAWSGACQEEVLGRMADNEYERRSAVTPLDVGEMYDDRFEFLLDLFCDSGSSHPLEIEIFAAALWGAICDCPALAASWAELVWSEVWGARASLEGQELADGNLLQPFYGNRIYVALKRSWDQFHVDHGIEEPCLKCCAGDCPLEARDC